MQFRITPPNGKSLSIYGAKLLQAALDYEDVHIGEWNRDYTIDWNPVYQYYRVVLKPRMGNGEKAQVSHYEDFQKWLELHGYRYEMQSSWEFLNDHTQIKTMQFDVYTAVQRGG
jgi:hypothetical protein